MDETTSFRTYDDATQTKELQILKASIPYLSASSQKQFALLIQYFEMQNTLSLVSNTSSALCACEIPDGVNRRSALLTSIREYCSPKEKETIDMLLNLFTVLDNYDLFVS